MERQWSCLTMKKYSQGLTDLIEWMLNPEPEKRPTVRQMLDSEYVKQKMGALCQQSASVVDSTSRWLQSDDTIDKSTKPPLVIDNVSEMVV